MSSVAILRFAPWRLLLMKISSGMVVAICPPRKLFQFMFQFISPFMSTRMLDDLIEEEKKMCREMATGEHLGCLPSL